VSIISADHAGGSGGQVARSFVVPDVVRRRAAADGDGGTEWVASLPQLAADLERRWDVEIGEQLPGGTAAVVARARTAAGEEAVVKIAVPDPDFPREAAALAAAEGRGYVRLHAADLERRALLLEPLGPSLVRSGLGPPEQLLILSDVLRQAWALPPEWAVVGEGPFDKAVALRELVIGLWSDLGEPCPPAVVDLAVRCADRRAARWDADTGVVVHGDAASANALQVRTPRPGGEAGYVLVDPDPFLGDPAYDLGVALRDWSPELLAGDPSSLLSGWCRLLALRSGLDPVAIWDWAFLERVSTGLYALSLGAAELARPLLVTAHALEAGLPDR
jgi:streptomycin 6-kinase